MNRYVLKDSIFLMMLMNTNNHGGFRGNVKILLFTINELPILM